MVVVGVMDRDSWTANTDNIVIADRGRRRLVWIPRDLWSDAVGDRVNRAFGLGGHALLCASMQELGFPVESSVVILRSAVERAITDLRITVPVDRTRRYWYPMAPTLLLQDGAQLIVFQPPQETLEGERIHQWVGARQSADTPPPRFPDLDRIGRQQILVRRLLEEKFDFSTVLHDPALIRPSDDMARESLTAVGTRWAMRAFDRVESKTIEGKMVLVPRRALLRRLWDNR